jgi:hypothetical protein
MTNENVVVEELAIPAPAPASRATSAPTPVLPELSQAERLLIASLDAYISNMAPNKQLSPSEGAKHQYNLWKIIQNVINLSQEKDFAKLYRILLNKFKEHENGVFGSKLVYRFADAWGNSQEDLASMQKILNLMKLTCSPNSRISGLRQVDLGKSISTGFTDVGKRRLIEFYQP